MSDLIDRDALRLMKAKECAGHTIEYAQGWKACIEWIKTLPSVEPERKKGKWVIDEHTYSGPNTYNYVCSACGAIGGSWLRDLPKNLMYPFCPFCGADMRGDR